MGEVASAVSTGDGLLFRGSDGVGESWQCLDVADSSSRIFYIAFRQRDVQYCSMWFHYFRKNKLVSYCSGRKIRKQKQHEAKIPKPRIPRDSSGFLDRLRRSLPWHVSAPSRWSRPLLLPSFVVLSPRGRRGGTRLGQVAQDTFRCWQSLQCWRLWA